MKFLNSFALLVCSFICMHCFAQQKKSDIVIKIVNTAKTAPMLTAHYYKLNTVGSPEVGEIRPEASSNGMVYKFPISEPLFVNFKGLGYFLAEPSDNVVLRVNGNYLNATGRGSEKYQLMDSIRKVKEALKKPSNESSIIIRSEADYLEWHDYIAAQLGKTVPLIDSYRNRLSPFASEFVRSATIDRALDDYSDRFIRWTYKSLGMKRERAIELYDTLYKPLTDKYFNYVAQHWGGTWKPIWWAVDRKYDFLYTAEDFDTDLERKLIYLKAGKEVFKGRAREKFYYDVLYKDLVKAHGFLPVVERELEKYYAESGYPEWKNYIKQKVQELRDKSNAKSAPDFELTDTTDKVLTKLDFKGKLVIFDYWFTGCAGCVQMAPAMRKLEKEFRNDSNVVFVNVSIDKSKEKWLKSVREGKYTSGSGINVYTAGQGDLHPMIRYYGISGYPSLIFMDAYGKAVNVYPKPDPRSTGGYQYMRDFIQKQLVEMKDGPYLIHRNDQVTSFSFDGLKMKKETHHKSTLKQVIVNTHKRGKTFTVQLKDRLLNDSAETYRPEKLLVLSDIEGNFEAFTRLLQANKVIDQSYNWTFGNGHLIFAGDMFDRGEQVTECLWLMYALEEKAKAARGYVHFVLGNHEMMNLQGDDRYAQQKYLSNASQVEKKLSQLYGEDSELGRWLRTKNIVEKIGDLLFVHGGIGLEFADLVKLPVTGINETAKPHYDSSETGKSDEANVRMIFDQLRGPLWYRLYYEKGDGRYYDVNDTTKKLTIKHPNQEQLERILAKYGAKRIITGHTIVADTISTHYNNRVINTDVPHAKGKSEALLIEGGAFYRVNDKGERKLLFREEVENVKIKK